MEKTLGKTRQRENLGKNKVGRKP
jgi:hypothetical protein